MDEAHLRRIARLTTEGTVVPFLGAGANLCGRPPGETFIAGKTLPGGAELARYLAKKSDYTADDADLGRVSQYVALMEGDQGLYDSLRSIFDHDYEPTELHRFLAQLPRILRDQGSAQYQLIVTTNYDDALERAFADEDEPVDVVIYLAEGADRGKFLHRNPEGDEQLIDIPNRYDGLSLAERTVVVKIHGAVDRLSPDGDSFVITEDHYIDYLTRSDISSLFPVKLAAKIQHSHFLFMGYGLRDWNLRVILHRIWGSQRLRYNSWSVQVNPDSLDERAWAQRDVTIISSPLDEYVIGLRQAMTALVADRAV